MSDSRIVAKNQADWDAFSASYLRYNHADKLIQRIVDDPSSAFKRVTWAQLQRHLPDLKGKRVCVPSSGDNHAVFAFALLGAQVTSCDISQPQLDAAAKVAEKLKLDITFVQADTMRLDDLPDDHFDLVYTSNGVHVWLNDLPEMYRNVHRILREGGVYIMCDVHPFQRPFGEGCKVVKPYDLTGPFEDETTITFTWRVQDILNPMADAGLRFIHMEEMQDEKDYVHPFWLPLEDIVNGVQVDPAEVDRLYDWRENPAMALPAWLCIVCRK